jgi:xylulokinase
VPVAVPEPEEYVALGAARQAAWVLAGTPAPPEWPRRGVEEYTGAPQAAIRDNLAALREATVTWEERIDG